MPAHWLPTTGTDMTGVTPRKLPLDAMPAAVVTITAWQQAPGQPPVCPLCRAKALTIVDRSARPYTAWFALSCGTCGLDDTITYAMGGTATSWS